MMASVTAIGVLLLAAAGPPTVADGLRQARRAAADLELESALAVAENTLRLGTATPEEVQSLYRLLGEVTAAVGHRPAATEWFARLLELAPDYRPSVDDSPRIHDAFAQATAMLQGERLRGTVRSVRRTPNEVETRVTVEGDRLGLVQGVRLHAREVSGFVPRPVPAHEGGWRGVWAPGLQKAEHFISLSDAYGNRLLSFGSAARPMTPEREPGAAAPGAPATAPLLSSERPSVDASVASSRPWYARPAPYLALCGVASAGALTAGWLFRSQELELQRMIADGRATHLYADAARLDAGRRRDFALMWISLGTALVSGTVGVLVW